MMGKALVESVVNFCQYVSLARVHYKSVVGPIECQSALVRHANGT